METSEASKEKLQGDFPQVEFGLNEESDAFKITRLLASEITRGGSNFRETVLHNHPSLTEFISLPKQELGEAVKKYVHEFYIAHKQETNNNQKGIQDAWNKYAPEFFGATRNIFPNTDWPKGEYKGYLSISPPCPRFLESKTFHVPYDSTRRAIRVGAHEMLHFLFYEYVRQRYLPDMPNTIEKEMNTRLAGKFTIPLWELSEIFNIVILSGSEFGAGQAKNPARSYPDLAIHVGEFEKLWLESGKNIDKLFSNLEVAS